MECPMWADIGGLIHRVVMHLAHGSAGPVGVASRRSWDAVLIERGASGRCL